jgi:outer membrane receptor for ferrienterochelin and colicin
MDTKANTNRKLKGLIFIVLLFFVHSFSYSQSTGGLKVIIRDSTNREFIPFASIRVVGTNIGTGTSTGGFYIISKIPVGKQRIEFNSIGYKTAYKDIVIKKDTFLLVNVLISPSPIVLQTVTKVTDRIKEFDESNISVRQITQQELKIIPLTVEKDFIRAIKVLPGVSSSSDVTSQFFVRGGSGDQNLILFDNMIIYNPFHTLGLFSVFNSDAIKSAEVLTGGFSPEYGGRLSSVLDISTRDGNKNKGSAKANIGLLTANGIVEGPVLGGSYFIAYRKSVFNNILKKFLNKDIPLNFYDLSGKLSFDIYDVGKVSFNYFRTNDAISNYSLSERDYSSKNNAFGATLQSFISNFIATTSISLSNYQANMTSIINDVVSPSSNEITSFAFNSKVDLLFSGNDFLSVGVALNNQSFRYSFVNSYGYKISSDDPLQEISAFGKYKFTQIENFTLDLGTRLNFSLLNSETYTNFEPRVNIKYNLRPDFAIKGSYSRMNQSIISTTNEDNVISLFEALLPLKPGFKPERADQYVLGFESLLLQSLSLNIQAYQKKITNYIGFNQDRKSRDDPDFVSGSGSSKGVETYIRYDGDNIFGWVTYNLNYADKTVNGITFPPRYDKRHSLNIILGTKLPLDIGMNIHWEYSSGMPFSPIVGYYDQTIFSGVPFDTTYMTVVKKALYGDKNSKRLPAYHKLDINFSKSITILNNFKANMSVDLNNVYDQKNIFYFDKTTNEKIYMLPFMCTFSVGVEL